MNMVSYVRHKFYALYHVRHNVFHLPDNTTHVLSLLCLMSKSLIRQYAYTQCFKSTLFLMKILSLFCVVENVLIFTFTKKISKLKSVSKISRRIC